MSDKVQYATPEANLLAEILAELKYANASKRAAEEFNRRQFEALGGHGTFTVTTDGGYTIRNAEGTA